MPLLGILSSYMLLIGLEEHALASIYVQGILLSFKDYDTIGKIVKRDLHINSVNINMVYDRTYRVVIVS